MGRATIYITTEHALPTQRLESILKSNAELKNHASPPSMDQIYSVHIPDLETQAHFLTYQLPVAIRSKNIGLVIIDSIAANYRAEIAMTRSDDGGKSRGKALAARSVDLVRTGALLREMARKYCCAVIVANQVQDRFEQRNVSEGQPRSPSSQGVRNGQHGSEKEFKSNLLDPRDLEAALPRSSPLSLPNHSPSPSPIPTWPASTPSQLLSTSLLDPRLTLDHQLRFFTGWGDDETHQQNSKTPALGLAWANQIACRIAIIRERSVLNSDEVTGLYDYLENTDLPESGLGGADWSKGKWRRWMRVVFSAWGPGVVGGDKGAEFEVWNGGLRAVTKI